MNIKYLKLIIGVILYIITNSIFAQPASGLLFNISSVGHSLNIKTTFANQSYPHAGIKIKSNQFSIGSGCLPAANGYCIFPANSSSAHTIVLNGSANAVDAVVCLNGLGPASCQNYAGIPLLASAKQLYVTNAYNNTQSIFVCNLNASDGSITSCQNADTNSALDGTNPQGIALNQSYTRAYITDGNSSAQFYQCDINQNDGTLANCVTTAITTPSNYGAGYGRIALNQANTFAYFVDNTTYRVISCAITSGVISGNCVDAGAHNIFDSGVEIVLNKAATTAYIADYDHGVYICGVNGATLDNTCTLKTGDGVITFTRPAGLALNPAEDRIYIADYSGAGTIYACDTSFSNCFVAANIANAGGIAINATNTIAYITDYASNTYACTIQPGGALASCVSTSGFYSTSGLAIRY